MSACGNYHIWAWNLSHATGTSFIKWQSQQHYQHYKSITQREEGAVQTSAQQKHIIRQAHEHPTCMIGGSVQSFFHHNNMDMAQMRTKQLIYTHTQIRRLVQDAPMLLGASLFKWMASGWLHGPPSPSLTVHPWRTNAQIRCKQTAIWFTRRTHRHVQSEIHAGPFCDHWIEQAASMRLLGPPMHQVKMVCLKDH